MLFFLQNLYIKTNTPHIKTEPERKLSNEKTIVLINIFYQKLSGEEDKRFLSWATNGNKLGKTKVWPNPGMSFMDHILYGTQQTWQNTMLLFPKPKKDNSNQGK